MGEVGFKVLGSSDPLVKLSVGFRSNSTSNIGRGEVVADGSIEEVAAWSFRAGSRGRQKVDCDVEGLELNVEKGGSVRSQKVRTVLNSKFTGSSDKEYELHNALTWKVTDAGGGEGRAKKKMILCSAPTAGGGGGGGDNNASRSEALLWSLTQFEELESKGNISQTRVVFFVTCKDSKDDPALQRDDHIKKHLNKLSELRKFFDRSREVDSLERRTFGERVKLEYMGSSNGGAGAATLNERVPQRSIPMLTKRR